MAIADITKPMALDETLQGTNAVLELLGKDATLQSIVTALATIGLNTVGNLASLTTEQKTSLVAAINEINAGKISTSAKGSANGVAELDSNGLVPANQLPSYVDDVLNGTAQNVTQTGAGTYSATAFILEGESTPCTPESGKTYVDITSEIQYRWTGLVFVSMGSNLTLGETSTTANRGDWGKTAYNHSQDANRVTSTTATGLYKIGATSQGHIAELVSVLKSDLTALGLIGEVTDSTTNGNIVVDGAETQVYDDTDITNAISDMGEDIEDIQDELSTDYATIEGNPINFTTLSAQNAKSTILSVEPIQDLHGYDYPWVGGAGKNKFDGVVELGTIGSNGEDLPNDNRCRSKNHIAVLPNTTYIFSVNGIATNVNWVLYDNTKTKIDGGGGGTGFTTPNNCYYVRWFYDLTVYQQTNYQLEVGSSPTSYEPYENICPITGRTEIGILGCGKNLYSGADQSFSYHNEVPFSLKAGTYTVSALTTTTASNRPTVIFYNGTTDLGRVYIASSESRGSGTITLAQDVTSLMFQSGETIGTSAAYSATFTDIQIEVGNQSSSYKPYTKSNDLTISLGQTVYGGTLDVENGVLVVDRSIVDLGSLSWSDVSSSNNRTDSSAILDKKYGETNLISENYEVITFTEMTSGKYGIRGSMASGSLFIVDPNLFGKTGAEVKTALTGRYVVYELATPITINLTPNTIKLLEGVNNISVDDANATISLTYRDGSVATLGDLTSAVDNLDSKIDESKILTDTATGDKYKLVVTSGVLSIEQISN